MPSKPVAPRPCKVCGRTVPFKAGRRVYCSNACYRARLNATWRSLRLVETNSETVRPEMQKARVTRVACLAALARLGLPLDLPLPADLLD